MEVLSIGSVANLVGLETYQLRYLLDAYPVVEDRRIKVGKREHRFFTVEDVDIIKNWMEEKTNAEK